MTATNSGPIRLLKTAFVVYYHEDLARARTFFLDFGLSIAQEQPGSEVFFKGYGTEPFVYVAKQAPSGSSSSFSGAAYVVDSREELHRAEGVPGATRITSLNAPGGGEIVTLTDPAGHKVHLVHGQTEQAETPPPGLKKLVVNYEDEKRRVGHFQRFDQAQRRSTAGAITASRTRRAGTRPCSTGTRR